MLKVARESQWALSIFEQAWACTIPHHICYSPILTYLTQLFNLWYASLKLVPRFRNLSVAGQSVRHKCTSGIPNAAVEGLNAAVEGLNAAVEGLNAAVEGLNAAVEGLNAAVEGQNAALEYLMQLWKT